MNNRKLAHTIELINGNINVQRQNAPDSTAATEAREENKRLFALLDSHGVQRTEELMAGMLAQ